MNIKIVNKSSHPLPSYSTLFSAGMDTRAPLDEESVLKAPGRVLGPTSLCIEWPAGFEAQIRHR